MSVEKHLKTLLIHQIKQKLAKTGSQVEVFNEPPPDLKILSYGMTIGYIDIVTEKEIESNRIEKWKSLIEHGSKLTILCAKEEKIKVADLLWKEGLVEKISIGTYDIILTLP